jgi:anti-anti-sigma factor
VGTSSPFVVTQRSDAVFVLTGELDMSTTPVLRGWMDPPTLAGQTLTFDVTGLTFIDSSGINALVDILDALGTGHLTIEGARANVREVFDFVGLTWFRNLKLADPVEGLEVDLEQDLSSSG